MWSAFKALAARIGLSSEQIADVERDGGVSLVRDPLNHHVQYVVRPDPDWTARMGEAWNETLINSRREAAGTISIGNGLLSIAEAREPENAISAQVVLGQYAVTFTVVHMGAEETYDYEEYVSHAFALLEGNRGVALIEPLTDENGIGLCINAYDIAFASDGVLREVAGGDAATWVLRIIDLMNPKYDDEIVSEYKSIKVENDNNTGAAIILCGGHGRGDYPLFRMADVNGDTIGVMVDFFVDNRPC